MRLFDYMCSACGHVFEELKNDTEPRDHAKCPKCGGKSLRYYGKTFPFIRVDLKKKAANVNARFKEGSYGLA